LGWGLSGAAAAQVILQLLLVVLLGGYRWYRDAVLLPAGVHPKATWAGWSWDCLQGWGEYFSFGLPAVAMVCLEWWVWEIIIMMAGE
jgi:MATE family multidrug resistance protein